jgi:hypothetical protein
MVTMIGKHDIFRMREGTYNCHLAQLLPQTGVRGTRYQPPAKLGQDKLFGASDKITVCIQTLWFQPDQRPPGNIGIESR